MALAAYATSICVYAIWVSSSDNRLRPISCWAERLSLTTGSIHVRAVRSSWACQGTGEQRYRRHCHGGRRRRRTFGWTSLLAPGWTCDETPVAVAADAIAPVTCEGAAFGSDVSFAGSSRRNNTVRPISCWTEWWSLTTNRAIRPVCGLGFPCTDLICLAS